MKNTSNKNKVKCLFGHHNYTVPNKNNPNILICSVCKRFGYRKWASGYEECYEYDKEGNMIHYKNSYGFEKWYEYDEKGNKIHCKRSDGYGLWWEYDEKDNLIYCKDSSGYEMRYDEKGNKIHFKNSDGFEEWYDGEEWKSVKPKNWKYEKHIK